MKVFVTALVAISILIALPAVAEQYCDDMETDLWTLGHENAVYNGIWYARYSTAAAHSPVRSIENYLAGIGADGKDADRAYAFQTIALDCGEVVESLSVWYNFMGVIAGSWNLDAHCSARLYEMSAVDDTLDRQTYGIAAFDNNGQHADHENMPGWYCQECRPDEYEPGAPDYCRLPDGSIQPPVGWWYRLKVSPYADLEVDWQDVEHVLVRLSAFGCFLHGDTIGVYWDDVCCKRTYMGPSATDAFSWSHIKALFR
jgi:hypothetical protein